MFKCHLVLKNAMHFLRKTKCLGIFVARLLDRSLVHLVMNRQAKTARSWSRNESPPLKHKTNSYFEQKKTVITDHGGSASYSHSKKLELFPSLIHIGLRGVTLLRADYNLCLPSSRPKNTVYLFCKLSPSLVDLSA